MERILWALILFWNVENYFAPFDFSEPYSRNASQTAGIILEHSKNLDSTVLIDNRNAKEFPTSENKPEQSSRFRNWKAFSHKRDGIAKTLCLVAERYGRFPDLIGLAEVENRWVLKQLAQNTVLAVQDYGIVHRDSPDSRGIDVALLYRRSTFRPLSVRFIPITIVSSPRPSDTLPLQEQVSDNGKKVEIHLDNETVCESTVTSKKVLNSRPDGRYEKYRNDILEDTLRTREILYVKGVLRGYDTLHVFVNHWPSKLGGKRAENHRCGIAGKLKWLCDSITASVEGESRICIEAKAEDSLGIEHSNGWGDNGRQVKVWHGAKIVIMGDFNADAGDAALRILNSGDCAVRSMAGGKEAPDMFMKTDADKEDAMLIDVTDGCFQKNDTMPGQGSDMCAEINKTAKINNRYNGNSEENVTYEREVHGSYKYKGEWSTIDRFYVSKYFVQDKEIFVESAEVFSHLFLLEQDKTYLGVKPKRSFIGPHYNGGLSDHLPVVLRFFSQLF